MRLVRDFVAIACTGSVSLSCLLSGPDATTTFDNPSSCALSLRLLYFIILQLVARPSSRPNSRLAAGTTRHAVPTLKQLALDGLVKGFEAKPTLAGIPPAFAPAVAQRLPVDLDPRLTVPAVHDENYWRRVCEEGWGWTKGKISLQDHGFSWKRAFCELYVAHMLENFGMYKDLPVGYEEEFCR